MFSPPAARALDTTKTNYISGHYYNQLIDDGNFTAINDYSVSDIQNFLTTNNSFLKDFSENGRTAAQIIYDAAHGLDPASVGTSNGIVINTTTGTVNPKVILTTLQKEQSLITKTTLDQRAADCAMGYEGGNGCQWMFDNNPQWKGFTNQVGWGAWQLRFNYERAQGHGFSDYQVAQTQSFSCDAVSYSVTIANRATSALYRYTPYVCNGNYNFWHLYNDWFGSGTPPPPPTPAVTTNDTSPISARTFNTTFTVTGSKATDSRVFYNNQEIAGTGTTGWRVDISPTAGQHDYPIQYRASDGTSVSDTKMVSIERHDVGDINGDGKVDLLDLSALSANWGLTAQDGNWSNLNPDTDNKVDIIDLSILASHWQG